MALLFGSLLGAITGVTPGLHPNTILAFIVALLIVVPVENVLVFLVAFGIVHAIMDVIPSVFVGAPDPGNALSALPAQRLYREGKGLEAIGTGAIGSVFGVIFAILFIPLVWVFLSPFYSVMRGAISIILIL